MGRGGWGRDAARERNRWGKPHPKRCWRDGLMRRRISRIVAVLPLLLALALGGLWMRSYWIDESFVYRTKRASPSDPSLSCLAIGSHSGGIEFEFLTVTVAGIQPPFPDVVSALGLLCHSDGWHRGEANTRRKHPRDSDTRYLWDCLGTWAYTMRMDFNYFRVAPMRKTVFFVTVPYWFVLLPLGILIFWQFLCLRRNRQRMKLGLCPACGYDLRASKERCPECGKPCPATGV
jgi:hypothetical protein